MTRKAVERVLERAEEFIVEAMNERTVPGSGVGVVSGSETVFRIGSGKTVFRVMGYA